MDVYFTIELTCDFSSTNENYYFRTKKEIQPNIPLKIGTVPLLLNRTHFDQIIGHLNSSGYETNYDISKLTRDMFVLPEGQYRFCITPYRWDGYNNSNPTRVGETTCHIFNICYTGSAPEITSPINGFSAANLNNSNPTNNLLNSRVIRDINSSSIRASGSSKKIMALSSDNRQSSQYTKLPRERNVVFTWTGVISNCMSVNDFNYIFKIVEVGQNQNVQEAIMQNGTLATINLQSKTSYIHDTVANRHFRFQNGHVYAAQVQAVPKKNIMSDIKLSNDGYSQVIAFVWGDDVPIVQNEINNGSTTSKESDNRESVLKSIQKPYIVNPGCDKENQSTSSFEKLTKGERIDVLGEALSTSNYVSTVENGELPYYQLEVANTIDVRWMPVRGDSIFRVKYDVELYEYTGGTIEENLVGTPLKSKSLEVLPPHDFSSTNTVLAEIDANDWVSELDKGFKYLILLRAAADYSYTTTTTYTITEYIHNFPTTRDSAVHKIAFGTENYTSHVIFKWGVDKDELDKVYPPQFTYPVDLSNKAWNDSTWTEIPEVTKRDDFKMQWKAASGEDYGDSVYYRLWVAKLPKGKLPKQVKDTLFFKDAITSTSYIDSVLFDSLKVGEQYVSVVQAYIVSKKNKHYDMLNNGRSLYATFKLIAPREYVADLNNKIKCSPKALDKLSKDIIMPKADSLVNNKVKVMMGDFPMVIQTITKTDTAKKSYSGDGYVIWHPLGVDVRLKVRFDSIQINKDYQVINGSAVSSATDSSTYIPAFMNDLDLEEWTTDDITYCMSQFGDMEKIKSYYNKFQQYGEKYGKKYGGLLGPLNGESLATEVLTFPLSVTDKEVTGSENIVFAINNMFFSPVTALMNFWAIFAAQDDDYYVPFLANNVCMDQRGFLGKADQHIDMFMGRSYEKKLNDGYVMRFKASSNFANPTDGTVISIDTGKLNYIIAQIEFDLDNNDFLGIEKDGTPRKGKIVKASLTTKFRSWSDWVAKISMDPFAVAGCDRFTFVPTGKGIFLDHSTKETPKEVNLTYEYLYGTPAPAEMKDEDKKKLTKATKEWKGFYWDELTVFLSDEISNTFTDKEDRKDSMVVYKYGINNTVTDSVHYSYPGSRINFGAKGLIIDEYGFTADLFARDLLTASTDKGWGWAFSLDTISVQFVKNKYKHALIKGGFGVPLFSGGFNYTCSIGADSLMFGISAKKNPLDLDLWAATVKFDSASSYFRIQKVYKESGTRVDLNMNGKLTINGKKLGLPSDFTAVKFEHLGMRNYNLSGKPKEGTASIKGFEFDIGEWSFASPQHYIGGVASENAENDSKDKNVASVSIGGFTFNLTKIDPIIEYLDDDLRLGVSVGGQMKFAAGTDFAASTGFSFWGVVQPKNKWNVKEVKGKLESIELDDVDFEVFKLSGKLDFKYASATSQDVTGFAGDLSVKIMSVVDLSMRAGFGKEKDNKGEFSWWFFDGACKFPGGIPLGAVSINGFSGGFSYNMAPKESLTSSKFSAKSLLAKAEENTNQGTTKSSGMDFKPARDNWVANAGISMVLTGAENTMNADGLVSLRISNGHFSGLFIEANAYVLTKMNKEATPGDGNNNSSPLIKAKAIMAYEKEKEYDYFRLSIAARADINLTSLLKGASSTVVSDKIAGASHSGVSMATDPNIVNKIKELNSSSDLTSHDKDARETAANESNNTGSSVGLSAFVVIPVDFELKHYKKNVGSHKAGSTDWYFAIGKPKYDERVCLSAELNLVVCKAKSEFTFYMQTGNAFAYQMPPLSKELQDFFGISTSDRKLDADKEQVKNSRKISNNDWLAIDKGGGFCLGSTFHAEINFNFFLYFEGKTDLGFDVALLDVGGMGCPGYPQIGKNNFYALGQAYAAIQCDVGLKLNLGFWKGKFSIFKAGIGALLQGGGPNPSYAYGLLRFKVNLLNGLLKFSTSCDFKVGDVCVPGAGDPLANVKLFQNVTPGYETENIAGQKNSLQSPLQIGTIVSNMPWNREVLLCDSEGKNARKFWFTLVESGCQYSQKSGSSFYVATGSDRLRYTPSNSDNNVILFEREAGGFKPNTVNKLKLQARVFEYRQCLKDDKNLNTISNGQGKDVKYNQKTCAIVDKDPAKGIWGWYDPTYISESKKGKLDVKIFKKDTTVFFKTNDIGDDLDNAVVFSWPYNGEINFPSKEYVKSGSNPYCNLYLYNSDYIEKFFDKTKLSEQGKELKIYLLKQGLEDGKIAECTYSYFSSTKVPYVQVKLPSEEFGKGRQSFGPHMLRFFIVEKNAYENALNAAMEAANITQVDAEYKSRISESTYKEAEKAHAAIYGSSSSSSGTSTSTSSGSGSSSSTTISSDFRPNANNTLYTNSSSNIKTPAISNSGMTISGSAQQVITGSIVRGATPVNTSSSSSSSSPNRTAKGVISNTNNVILTQGISRTVAGIVNSGVLTQAAIIPNKASQITQAATTNKGSSGRTVGKIANESYTPPKPINIRNYQLNEIYENKQSDGKDSMTYYRTKLREGYKISAAIGQEIYKWTWFVSYDYDYYSELINDQFSSSSDNQNLAKLYYQLKVNKQSSIVEMNSYLKINPVYSGPMNEHAYLFLPYAPNDKAKYHTKCELPPLAYLALDNYRANSNSLMRMHKKYFEHLLDLEKDFKNSALVINWRVYHKDGKVQYQSKGDNYAEGKVDECKNIMKGGLVLDDNNPFDKIDYRLQENSFYRPTEANYHPTYWHIPCLLDVVVTGQERQPMDEECFKNHIAWEGHYPFRYNKTEEWKWYIKDYATVAMSKDIKRIRNFMAENQLHARALDKRGWSYKRGIVKDVFNNINNTIQYSDFPYQTPKLYWANHFMNVLDIVVDHVRNNKKYISPAGGSYRFYNKDDDFIPVDKLYKNAAIWAKYWWGAAAQCLDLGEKGFDEFFYLWPTTHKYWDVTSGSYSLNNGKHIDKMHSSKNDILGSWYTVDNYKILGGSIDNYLTIYYLTSKNPNFGIKLMEMAEAVKNSSVQNTKYFFANGKTSSESTSYYYTINLNTFRDSNFNRNLEEGGSKLKIKLE